MAETKCQVKGLSQAAPPFWLSRFPTGVLDRLDSRRHNRTRRGRLGTRQFASDNFRGLGPGDILNPA